jgi:hypothetical protein
MCSTAGYKVGAYKPHAQLTSPCFFAGWIFSLCLDLLCLLLAIKLLVPEPGTVCLLGLLMIICVYTPLLLHVTWGALAASSMLTHGTKRLLSIWRCESDRLALFIISMKTNLDGRGLSIFRAPCRRGHPEGDDGMMSHVGHPRASCGPPFTWTMCLDL